MKKKITLVLVVVIIMLVIITMAVKCNTTSEAYIPSELTPYSMNAEINVAAISPLTYDTGLNENLIELDCLCSDEEYGFYFEDEEYPEAAICWTYLKNLGYNDYVCAGIMGNFMAEVGGQTLAIQPDAIGGKSYYGICQWSKKFYADAWGLTLEEQLDYLAATIEKEFKAFGKKTSGYSYEDFLEIDDEKEAALVFAKTYERCGSGSYKQRQTNATNALNHYTN